MSLAFAGKEPTNSFKSRIAVQPIFTLLILLIAGVWIFAGLSKLAELENFAKVLRRHGVLPTALIPFAWVIGLGEVLYGLAFVSLSARRKSFAALVYLGIVALLVLSAYLLLVPIEAIRDVGCGCQSVLKRVLPQAEADRTWSLWMNGVFAVANVGALLLQRSCQPKRADDAA